MAKRLVLVTGASRGLGLAVVRRLSKEGYRVIAAARSITPELEFDPDPGEVYCEKVDLADVARLHSWVTYITKKHGRIYGLINNAAVGHDGVLTTMHERDIGETLRIDLESPIVLTKYVSRSMLLAGEGRIINVSSIIADTGFSGLSVYAAAKAGLIGFTKSLSRELGKLGITVNSVAPGYMETQMTGQIAADKLAAIRRRSPFGKLVTVQDAAGAVAFLLGEDARMITGTTITVDAGSTA